MGRKRVKKEVVVNNDKQEEEKTTKRENNKKLKSSENFKCSECSDYFDTETNANKHIFKEHYGLARINDDSKTPFTESEILKALIKAQKAIKVLKCKNNGCDKSFRSGLGLKMHWDLCGKSEMETTSECEICGKRLKKSSIPIHMKTHVINERSVVSENSESDEQTLEDNSGNTSRKRASAIRAQKTIRKSTKGELIIGGNTTDEEFNYNSDTTEDNSSEGEAERPTGTPNLAQKQNIEQNFKTVLKLWADFVVSVNDFLREVPKGSLEKWKKQMTTTGKVKCPLKDCNQEFTSKEGLKYHYQRCGMDLKFMWKCKICGFEVYKGNRLIVQHLLSKHKESIPQISRELSECIETASVAIIKSRSDRTTPSFETMDSVIDFHKRFYQRKSFPNLLPNIHNWIALNEDEYNTYIQDQNPSVHFKSTLSSEKSWIQLNLFESIATPQSLNIFVGGPVWASAWCPLPLSSTNRDQFVAIASNMSPEISHTLNDTDIESGLIQLWNVGPLDKQFDSSLKPRMAFSISHFCGMIWDMDWCPGGTAWEDMNLFERTNSEILCRIGLLAVACGDGFIRIHSIPHPEALPNSYEYSLYYNEPDVILNPPGVGNSVNSENTICKCLSWIRSNDQNLIVGGYGSGIIAVWDINTKSSLLIVEQNPSQTILRPMNSWIGHSAAVNRIKWFHNSSDQFLVSCSFDRSAKLWNLKDLCLPITVYKRGLFTAIDTHLQWNGMFLSGDDCYQGFQNNTVFKDFGSFNFGAISLTAHKSCVWDLSVSEWTSATVSADAAGEAVIFPNFQLKGDIKLKIYDRIPLYHISPLLLETSTSDTTGTKQRGGRNKSKNSLVSEGIDPLEPPIRNFRQFSSKYGLIFNDYDLSNLKAIPIDEINRIRLPTPMQYQRLNDYPFLSINRVCWNPNLRSCAWVLSATQSGLCRLSCVSFLNPSQTNTN